MALPLAGQSLKTNYSFLQMQSGKIILCLIQILMFLQAPALSGTISAAPKDSLDKFRDILKSKYNYDAGAYDNRPNFVTKNRKFLGKNRLEH